MLRYFDKIIKKLFDELLLKTPYRHKTKLKQIKDSFYRKEYVLTNMGILSVIYEFVDFNKKI